MKNEGRCMPQVIAKIEYYASLMEHYRKSINALHKSNIDLSSPEAVTLSQKFDRAHTQYTIQRLKYQELTKK